MDGEHETPHQGLSNEDGSSSSRTAVETGSIDLVGGPFAVIESDPGVFTSLTRKLGVRSLSVVEIYDIEPWAVDHLQPRGLIFCFLWRKDTHRPGEFEDPAAEHVWFANQLCDDACASQAILNVVLNCPEVDIGEELRIFRDETVEMSPVMKGLAISNSSLIREVHNSLARPTDLRGALNALTTATLDASKSKKAKANPPPAKRRKPNDTTQKARKSDAEDDDDSGNEETYHFIGYVPAYGKVWELDGLKSGPLEVGELPDPSDSMKGWMDIARPALRMKMQKYGGAADGEGAGNIRFSLLALVGDNYMVVSDELEMLKREKVYIERKLEERFPAGWSDQVDLDLLPAASESFATSVQPATFGQTFAPDFGSRKLEKEVAVLDMPLRNLPRAWETCVRAAMSAKINIEEEVAKSSQAYTDHVKRTHDYELFIQDFVTRLHAEGVLNPLLGRDNDGKKQPESKTKKTKTKTKR